MSAIMDLKTLENAVAAGMSRAGSASAALVAQAFREALNDPGGRHLVIRLDADDPLLEDAYRSVAEHLPALLAARRRALVERNINALVDILLPEAPADDPHRAIAFDNAVARARFLAETPCLTSKEVAALAGHRARNTSMTASRWKQAGKVFSVPRSGDDLYPTFQFRDGQPHPTIQSVLAALPARKRPWQVAFWFVSSNGWLDGASPAERLDQPDAVIAAACREAEAIIG